MKFRLSTLCVACGFLSAPTTTFAQSPVWGLQPGDLFSVETTIQQKTTIAIDGMPPQTESTTERIVAQYHVDFVRRGETLVSVRCVAAEAMSSQKGDSRWRAQRLTQIPIRLLLNNNGVASSLDKIEDVQAQLANGNDRAFSILKQSVTDDVFRSWFDVPFWVTAPEKGEAESWERIWETSHGFFGRCRTVLTFDRGESSKEQQTLTLTANSSHFPNVTLPAKGKLRFEDVALKFEDFQGEAVVVQPQSPASDAAIAVPARRPRFEELRMQWTVKGNATLAAGDRKQVVRFTQNNEQKSKLMPTYRMRMPL